MGNKSNENQKIMEYELICRRLKEFALLCKPHDVISFSIRFFQDEASPQSSIDHAFHCLPFVLFNNEAFRSFACTIFSSEISKLGGSRDCLDGDKVSSILTRMQSAEGFQLNHAISEVWL